MQMVRTTIVLTEEECRQKLEGWKTIIQKSKGNIEAGIHILHGGTVQKMISETAAMIHPDLIVIGKNSNHSWFPFLNKVGSNELVKITGYPVLTVKPGALNNRIRSLVVPIAGEVPSEKMDVIRAIVKNCSLKIHLVTFMGEDTGPDSFSASSLLQVYQWLKSYVRCPVEYAVLHGNNKAKALLSYAEKINADVLLVNPQSETRIGWFNRQISDVLPAGSKMQVLAVQPTHSLTT
jgi:hypothetical protein